MSYSSRRRSSAYDFASLRLHPDGTRVSQSSSTNRNPRNSRLTLQDSRGNWIARDAAGLTTVPKYRRVRQLAQDEEQGSSSSSGKKRKANGKKPDPRAVKRRKFYDDFEFLTATVDKSLPSSVNPFLIFILTNSWLYNLGSTQMPALLRGQLLSPTGPTSQRVPRVSSDEETQRAAPT